MVRLKIVVAAQIAASCSRMSSGYLPRHVNDEAFTAISGADIGALGAGHHGPAVGAPDR
jgi:hypothetical protein